MILKHNQKLMKYMGSKNRIAKEILPIILKDRKTNQVYISEYDAPNDFKCVWSKEIKSYMKPSRAIDCTERLFVFSNLKKYV